MAEETNTEIGTTVGFCARFQDVLTPVRDYHGIFVHPGRLQSVTGSCSYHGYNLALALHKQTTKNVVLLTAQLVVAATLTNASPRRLVCAPAGGDPAQVHNR